LAFFLNRLIWVSWCLASHKLLSKPAAKVATMKLLSPKCPLF